MISMRVFFAATFWLFWCVRGTPVTTKIIDPSLNAPSRVATSSDGDTIFVLLADGHLIKIVDWRTTPLQSSTIATTLNSPNVSALHFQRSLFHTIIIADLFSLSLSLSPAHLLHHLGDCIKRGGNHRLHHEQQPYCPESRVRCDEWKLGGDHGGW